MIACSIFCHFASPRPLAEDRQTDRPTMPQHLLPAIFFLPAIIYKLCSVSGQKKKPDYVRSFAACELSMPVRQRKKTTKVHKVSVSPKVAEWHHRPRGLTFLNSCLKRKLFMAHPVCTIDDVRSRARVTDTDRSRRSELSLKGGDSKVCLFGFCSEWDNCAREWNVSLWLLLFPVVDGHHVLAGVPNVVWGHQMPVRMKPKPNIMTCYCL